MSETAIPKGKKEKWPKVKRVEHKNGTSAWLVDARIAGKGERLFFKTRGEADTRADQLRAARANQGVAGVAFPEKLRIEALECADILKPLNASLREAVDYFVKHARPGAGAKKVSAVKDEFLMAKKRAERRAEYLRVQSAILSHFCQTFGERNIHEVGAREIEDWINGHLNWVPRTRLNYFCDLRNFFGFAVRRNYAASNPVLSIEKPSLDEKDPENLSPVQAKALLTATETLGGKLTAFVAIGLFAGLRTAELLKLNWRDIDLSDKTIKVDAAAAKTRQSRYVTMSNNLVAWLKPYEKSEGFVRPAAWRWHFKVVRKTAAIVPWPDNAMRHSFGSYHFAEHSNAPLTAAALGHHGSTRTLFEHYRKLAKPSDAKAFWALRPGPQKRKSRSVAESEPKVPVRGRGLTALATAPA